MDPNDYRSVISNFATGVTIVTTAVDGYLHGMTASAVASVSLEPVQLLVCVEKSAHTHGHLQQAGAFTVCILAEDQEAVSTTFAKSNEPEEGRLQGVDYRIGGNGAPIVEGCVAHIECEVASQAEGGDHTIFIGRVLAAELDRDAAPLLYYRSKYGKVAR